jgi:hypothetical protein
MCAWESGGEVQIATLRKRVPAMGERLWAAGADPDWDAFNARLRATDVVLLRLLPVCCSDRPRHRRVSSM